MGKIKILEIAAEAGVSNNEAISKAKELGFNVKVAGSSISSEEAEELMEHILLEKDGNALKNPENHKKSVKKGLGTILEDIEEDIDIEAALEFFQSHLNEQGFTYAQYMKHLTKNREFRCLCDFIKHAILR